MDFIKVATAWAPHNAPPHH